ncbi:OLC1v1036109C2 [Oldenlandia corymbosa var. corymbosa]|nr:OLC1v1036109C2 [Oldenlandia corymbosa var. corymbosa]
MHYGNGLLTRCRDVLETEFEHCTDLNTTQFLRRLIEVEKPDFVAFTGDNIFGTSATDAAESLLEAFGPVLESGLPWAAVLGNHDQESTMSRRELMSFISLMDFSLSKTYPSDEDSEDSSMHYIDGFGNYNLEVLGALGSSFANCSVLNLYFLDSGDRATVNGIRTYGWIKESQLGWLRGVSNKFQGKCLDMKSVDISPAWLNPPALAFFHIPIPEIRQVPMKEIVGQYQEHAAVSIVNSGVFQSFTSMGNLKAVFIGHDHTNDFCGKLDSIWFCYGGGIGYHGYGRAGWPRRARIILAELAKGDRTWTGVERVTTWKRLDDGKLSRIDEHVLWDRYSSQ